MGIRDIQQSSPETWRPRSIGHFDCHLHRFLWLLSHEHFEIGQKPFMKPLKISDENYLRLWPEGVCKRIRMKTKEEKKEEERKRK